MSRKRPLLSQGPEKTCIILGEPYVYLQGPEKTCIILGEPSVDLHAHTNFFSPIHIRPPSIKLPLETYLWIAAFRGRD